MRNKTKELYFALSICIILMLGFFLGAYFNSKLCYKQTNFKAEHIEECNNERLDYQALCGDLEYLKQNKDLQVCINECNTKYR